MSIDSAKIRQTIDILRKLYRDGDLIRQDYLENTFGTESKARGWVVRARVLFTHLFYNSKFIEDFEKNVNEACCSYGDSTNYQMAVDLLLGYIEGIALSIKHGYIKDQYTGVDNDTARDVFVAMSFEPTLEDNYFVGIEPAIRELGYNPIRVDKVHHNEKIDTKIFDLISKSRFVVADFSGQRTGVYYEAGFASGLGLPVIHVCNSTDFDKLHFDIQTINTIKFDAPSKLKPLLAERIKATIGSYRIQDKQKANLDDDMPF